MSDHAADRGEAVRPDHDDPLPGSIEAGNALHTILEYLDYTSVSGVDSWRDWLDETTGDRTVRALVDEVLDEHRFEPARFRAYTAQILFDALRAPLSTDGGELPSAAELDGGGTAREVSFLLPIPQDGAQCLGAVPAHGTPIDTGYFTGEIDLVFEHDSRVYIADWKSDTRIGGDAYDRQTLGEHVESNYRTQIAVYTTVLMRMLNIESQDQYERFGGFFYLFVRGMDPGGEGGQFFERLPWSETVQLCRRFTEMSPKEAIESWTKCRGGMQ